MKNTLGVPLQIPQEISHLCLFHEIFHRNVTLRHKLLTPAFYIFARIDHNYKVGIPNLTRLFKYSFRPQAQIDWNHLPTSSVNITDVG